MKIRQDQVTQQLTALGLLYPDLHDDPEAWTLSVESETDLYELLRQIERRRQEVASFAEAIANNMDDLELRKKRYEHIEQIMRQLSFKLMQIADIKKAELPEATLSIRVGTQHVIITNEEAIPDILCRIKREPNKTRLKELLLEGKHVQGATLSNAEPTITIRTK